MISNTNFRRGTVGFANFNQWHDNSYYDTWEEGYAADMDYTRRGRMGMMVGEFKPKLSDIKAHQKFILNGFSMMPGVMCYVVGEGKFNLRERLDIAPNDLIDIMVVQNQRGTYMQITVAQLNELIFDWINWGHEHEYMQA